MVKNPKFTIQLLEKIGAPLAAAIEAVPLKNDHEGEQAAKLMAQMLGQAVQISIALNSSFNVVEEEAQADSTRLALAALAAPLIAEFYMHNERVPEDQDIKRLSKSLESVVAFADNFSAAEEGKSRLSTLEEDAPLFDKTQTSLVTIQAISPVIMAVAEFPFGQSETKLVHEISGKLETMAADIAKKAQLSDKLSELLIFKSLANLYAQCHRAQTQKLASNTANDANRAELSLDPVWEAFGMRVAMIEAVMGLENQAQPSSQQASSVKLEETPKPTVVSESVSAPQALPPTTVVPAAGGSPMGFFKKLDTSVPVAPVQEPEATPPPPVSPEPVLVPAQEPENPAETPSSPMGFFKKPDAQKNDENNT